MTSRGVPRTTSIVVAVLLAVLVAACGSGAGADPEDAGPRASTGDRPPPQTAGAAESAAPGFAVDPPGPLELPLYPHDILVYSDQPLDDDMLRRIRRIDGVTHIESLSMANVSVEDYTLTLAAVDPGSYRRFTPVNTAQLQEAWDRVAGGEMAIDPQIGKRLQDDDGSIRLGNHEDADVVHIGAYAPQVRQIDAVVNAEWGKALGMRPGNALLVTTGMTAPQEVRKPLQRIVGDGVSVQILGPDLDLDAFQTAFLTGGSVAEAVGTFSYRVIEGGRLQPDAAWVAANIRTEEVPILGRVTCHKVMLAQLRAALTEVQLVGLADKIYPDQYAGCYYPRFIANTTRPSLHSWGIALDMNVPGNQRGTVGEMDRGIVAIFKKWGFAWGGDWSWTDPMHFELNRLVEVR